MKHVKITLILIGLLSQPALVFGGGLDPMGGPSGGSGMPTLQGICSQLDTGTQAPLLTGPFSEPASGPGPTACTLTQLRDKAPVSDAAGAAPGDVMSGKKYWGLLSGSWGVRTGTLATQTPTNTTTLQPAGFYNSFDLSAVDTDLAPENIRSGVTVFGVAGTVVPGALAKRVNKTGQTACWDAAGAPATCTGSGQDGEYQYGIDPVLAPTGGSTGAYNTPSWTGTRFFDNGNGTVTDNVTALIWMKDALCKDTVNGVPNASGFLSWAQALTWCNNMASGACGLSDGSSIGDWRLPNVNELHSLGPVWPPGPPFVNEEIFYWSSTTFASDTIAAWYVIFSYDFVQAIDKITSYPVRCVRGGQ